MQEKVEAAGEKVVGVGTALDKKFQALAWDYPEEVRSAGGIFGQTVVGLLTEQTGCLRVLPAGVKVRQSAVRLLQP